MSKYRIACIGDLLVEIMRPDVGDPLGEPGVFLGPFPSGASGIFIDAVARLGLEARFVGSVGDDDFGHMIVNRLRADGVDVSHIKIISTHATAVAFVTYFNDGSRKFIFHLANAASGQIAPEDIDAEYLADVTYLHIIGSTLSTNDNCLRACMKAVEITVDRGGRISFDPNFRPELVSAATVRKLFEPVLSLSHIVFPTEDEIRVLTGRDDLDEAAEKLLAMGPEVVAIKQGVRGSTVYTAQEKCHLPAFAVDEVDPTGAGDCFCAGFLTAYLRRMSLAETARFANAVGALAVTRKGPMEGAPRFEEVRDFLESAAQR